MRAGRRRVRRQPFHHHPRKRRSISPSPFGAMFGEVSDRGGSLFLETPEVGLLRALRVNMSRVVVLPPSGGGADAGKAIQAQRAHIPAYTARAGG